MDDPRTENDMFEFDFFQDEVEPVWTDEDEAALEEWEERRRERLAELNEY